MVTFCFLSRDWTITNLIGIFLYRVPVSFATANRSYMNVFQWTPGINQLVICNPMNSTVSTAALFSLELMASGAPGSCMCNGCTNGRFQCHWNSCQANSFVVSWVYSLQLQFTYEQFSFGGFNTKNPLVRSVPLQDRKGSTNEPLRFNMRIWPGLFHLQGLFKDMGVSKNNGTPKSSILKRAFHYKPSILGHPYFWKHPYVCRLRDQKKWLVDYVDSLKLGGFPTPQPASGQSILTPEGFTKKGYTPEGFRFTI